jgi:hypothetical protein
VDCHPEANLIRATKLALSINPVIQFLPSANTRCLPVIISILNYTKEHDVNKENKPLTRFEVNCTTMASEKMQKFFTTAQSSRHALLSKEIPADVNDFICHPASIYDELVHENIENMGSHVSDLYVPVSDKATEILNHYPIHKANATTFKSEIDGKMNYDIPFAYKPYWDAKAKFDAQEPQPFAGLNQ